MNIYEIVFTLANLYVMPFWFLMVVLPGWTITRRVMGTYWPFVPLALAYAALILPGIGQSFSSIANPSIDGLAALLGTAQGVTVGWIHFLAFDLFVGRWAYLDSQERGIHPLIVAPTLALTLLLGPIGFLLYALLRAWHLRKARSEQPLAMSDMR